MFQHKCQFVDHQTAIMRNLAIHLEDNKFVNLDRHIRTNQECSLEYR